MVNYLLKAKFFAGSDDKSDIDEDMFVLSTKTPVSKEEVVQVFTKANSLCDPYEEHEKLPAGFPSYDDGLNLDTLVEGVNRLLENGSMTSLTRYPEALKGKTFEEYYSLEQWQ